MDWSGVRDRVIAVERARGGRRTQRGVFERVLTSEEIAEVESEIGVALPEEYASFLAEVGSGGPGPELELTTLCRLEGRWGWTWCDADTWLATDARGPFLENDEWIGHQIATLRGAGFEPTVRDDEDDFFGDYVRAFGEDDGYRQFCEQRLCGTVHISDNGCGMTSWLVMVGLHRGEIWFNDAAFNPPLEQLVDVNGEPHNFYTWYIDWLERQEARVGIRTPRTCPERELRRQR
jgi:hypothetical protein